MTTFTLHISETNKRVLAILNLLRETEEITLEENSSDFQLSKVQKFDLDERKENYLTGKSKPYSWDEVKNRLKVS